jgi:uncharacterized membrane protein
MPEMVEQILNLDIARQLIVIIIAALPVVELRGALPIAINVFNMPWYWAYALAVIGNMLPVPILLLFFDGLARLVSKLPVGKKVVDWVFRHTRRHEAMIQKYEWLGLMLFVAVPLPITGAWTGSIIAFILGMRFTYSLLSILCGVIIAGAIVTSLCLLGWIGAIIAGVVLAALAIIGWWRTQPIS